MSSTFGGCVLRLCRRAFPVLLKTWLRAFRTERWKVAGRNALTGVPTGGTTFGIPSPSYKYYVEDSPTICGGKADVA